MGQNMIHDCEKRKKTGEAKTVTAAGGKETLEHYVMSDLPALGFDVKVNVLPKSPCALSLGQLCADHGCTFSWEGGAKKPRLTDRFGVEIPIFVRNYVPYIGRRRVPM